MLRKLLFTSLMVFTINFLFAQDTIHMINRETIVAKVQEINPKQVKYKLYSFQNGPVYVISKSDVNNIVYSDGHVEYFHEPIDEEIEQVHPLFVGINSFDLMFGFVTLSGEYYFPKRGISIKVPVSIGLKGIKGANSDEYYNDSYYYYSQLKTVSVGAQLLFYPSHLKRNVNYFTGLAFEYGHSTAKYNYYNGPYYLPYSRTRNNDWFGTGIVNGVLIELSDRVNLGLSATMGLQVVYQTYQVNYIGVTDVHPEPMGRLDFNLGIRLGKIKHDETP